MHHFAHFGSFGHGGGLAFIVIAVLFFVAVARS